MANTRNLSLAFNGGELSPEMYGRMDDQRYQFGVRTMKNFQCLPQGPARKRWGFQFVAETKDSTKKSRLISVNSSPSTVLEVGTNYFRFYENSQQLSYQYVAADYKLPATVTFNTANGHVTFGSAHGYLTNEAIGFTSGGNMPIITSYSPIGFTASSGLYNTPTTGSPHKLIVNDPFSRAQPVPTGGDPYFYAEPTAAYNTGYSFRVRNAAGAAVTPTTGGPATSGAYYLYLSSIDTLVNPRQRADRYYVDIVSSTVIRIRPVSGVTAWAGFTTAGTGTIKCHKYYAPGQIVYWGNPGNVGQAAGFYECTAATYSLDTGPEVGKWTLKTNVPLEVANPVAYAESELAELSYAQSGATILIAHKKYQTVQLRRISQGWSASLLAINSELDPPSSVSASASTGPRIAVTRSDGEASNSITYASILTQADHGYVIGDYLYFRGTGNSALDNNIWCVALPFSPPTPTFKARVCLKACGLTVGYSNGTILTQSLLTAAGSATFSAGATVELWPDGSESSNTYTVTAINSDGIESEPTTPGATIVNNIYQRGAFNTITWQPVAGAVKYRIYRQFSGLYGLIGETDGGAPQSFKDENISPDFSVNPPKIDRSLELAGENPQAVAFYEQRSIFAGTNSSPGKVWMTRSFTLNDLGYRIPFQATDRIAFTLASKEVQTIRHVIPLQDLLVLTDKSEYRVTSVNSDGITPTSIYVRPQSFIGAGYPTPVTINNSLIFASARGGRLREAGFDSRVGGYVTGDISLRASHLFDNYTVTDLAYTRAPQPIVWAVSSTGKLLGFTYVPEERVGGWHQHVTDGVVESIASAQDNESDYLYAIIRRTINGVEKRYVEKVQMSVLDTLPGAQYLDCFALGSYTNPSAGHTMTLSTAAFGGFAAKDSVQITSSQSTFTGSDVGDQLYLTYAGGTTVIVTITSVQSGTVATGSLVDAAPVSSQGVATNSWAWARDSYSGLSYLEGKTVGVVGDGEYIGDFTVSGGVVSLGKPYLKVAIGLKYDAELETLAIAQQAEGLLQGRMKNVNKVWLRTLGSKSFYVGPRKSGQLAPALVEQTEDGTEHQVLLPGEWSEDGSIRIVQTDPVPLMLIGMTAQVALGG